MARPYMRPNMGAFVSDTPECTHTQSTVMYGPPLRIGSVSATLVHICSYKILVGILSEANRIISNMSSMY